MTKQKNFRRSAVAIALAVAMLATCFAFIGQADVSASSKGAKKATKWAKRIADNNAYTYGWTGDGCPACHKKAKKQYICTTFVVAAFAHGANSKEAKRWCGGKSGTGTVQGLWSAMKSSKNWKDMGRLSKKRLKKGDVIFWPGHVEIYYGNGKIVGAHGKKYSKKAQISVRNLYGGWVSIMRYKK